MLNFKNVVAEGFTAAKDGAKTGTNEKGFWASISASVNATNKNDPDDHTTLWVDIVGRGEGKTDKFKSAAELIAVTPNGVRFVATGRLEFTAYQGKLKATLYADTFAPIGTSGGTVEPAHKPVAEQANRSPGVQAQRPKGMTPLTPGELAALEEAVPF